ncbi:MAG: c-type cytochrome domain-containing protein [Planctomycetota bacterium]|nr:c-type cytochrome domain-containing protein [Planctomycetota bacterium]
MMRILPTYRLIPCLLLTGGFLMVFTPTNRVSAEDDKKEAKLTFDDQVKPLLMQRCGNCHNSDKKSADLDLSNYTNMMQGGASGSVIEPGSASDSYLFMLITHEETPIMPPGENNKLKPEQIDLIARWIDAGALENQGSKARISKPKFDMTVSGSASTRPEVVANWPRLVLETQLKTERPTAVPTMATSPWSPTTAIAGQKQILLYDNAKQQLTGILPFPEGQATVLKFSRNGSLLMAAGGQHGAGGKVYVWDVKTGQRVMQVGDEIDSILAADLSANHKMIALGGPQKMIRVYSTADGSLLYEVKKHTDWVTSIEFSPDNVLLATGDRNGGLHVWEAETGNEYLTLKAHSQMISDISWRLDANVLASASQDSTIRLWEMENGAQVKNWGAHGNGVTSLDFTRDGHLVSSGRDKVAKLWQQDGKQVRQFPALADETLAVTFCNETSKLICSDWTGIVRVFKSDDGTHLADYDTNPAQLSEKLKYSEAQLVEANQKHAPLVTQLNATVAKVNELTTKIQSAQQVITQAEAKLNEQKKQLATLNQQLESTKAQLAVHQKELATKVQAKPMLEQSLQKANEAVVTLGQDEELKATAGAIAGKLTQVDARITQLQQLVTQLTQTQSTTEKQVAELNTQLQGTQSEMTAAVTQLQGLQKEKAPVDQQKATQEQQTQAAGQQVAHWQGQVNWLKGEIEFKAAMEKVSTELNNATEAIATEDIALQEVEKKLAGVEQEVASQKANKQAAEQKAAEIRQRMYELQGIAK